MGNRNVYWGIFVNDSDNNWSFQIVHGLKTIETRTSRTLDRFVGQRVAIVRTGCGYPCIVGYVTIGEPKVYTDLESFSNDDFMHHCKFTKYDFHDGQKKYGYRILDAVACSPIPVTNNKGRKRSGRQAICVSGLC